MSQHDEWVEARERLARASKHFHYWKTMPDEMRRKLGGAAYRAKCLDASRRLKQADKLCFEADAARRVAARYESAAERSSEPPQWIG